MNPFVALSVFAAAWQRLAPLLDQAATALLGAELAALRALDPGTRAADELARHVVKTVLLGLPEDEAAQLRGRYGEGGRFWDGPQEPPGPPGFGWSDLCLLVVDRNPMVGPVLGPVRDRLLREPSLDADRLMDLGGEPDDERLIRLTDLAGAARYPAFQFEAAGMPYRAVHDVNLLLEAGSDPWGAAEWWRVAGTVFNAANAHPALPALAAPFVAVAAVVTDRFVGGVIATPDNLGDPLAIAGLVTVIGLSAADLVLLRRRGLGLTQDPPEPAPRPRTGPEPEPGPGPVPGPGGGTAPAAAPGSGYWE
ncbi:hypothetical protein [Streptomyces sp. NPDC048340]|uniref:hypothetical protein n=1 Tax=Streptomyces sp. NPDC048340 TaxID=3365537 RepID=UPI003719DF49